MLRFMRPQRVGQDRATEQTDIGVGERCTFGLEVLSAGNGVGPSGSLGSIPLSRELGRKTKVLGGSDTHRSSLSAATHLHLCLEAAPPNATLSALSPPPPAPAGLRQHVPRVCAPLSARGAPPPPLPAQAHTHPRLTASLNRRAPLLLFPVPSAPVSPLLPPLSRLLHPIQHAVLKALPWRPVACSPGSSPVGAAGLTPQSSTTHGLPLLYVKVIFRMF